MLGPERDRRVDGLEPVADALLRQPHHEVQADIVEAGGPRLAERRAGAVHAVQPREALELLFPERLHAETDAIHAGAPVCREPRLGHRLGVRLHRDLAARRDVEGRRAGADDPRDLVGLEERRRPAAEVDRVRCGAVRPEGLPDTWRRTAVGHLARRAGPQACLADLQDQRVDVTHLQIRIEQPAVEVAVVADS